MDTLKLSDKMFYDMASYVFWLAVESHGFPTAQQMSFDGLEIFKSNKKINIALAEFGVNNLEDINCVPIKERIIDVIKHCIETEDNLDGVVYGDDLKKLRTPSAENIKFYRKSKPFTLSTNHIEKLGKLCLRHPLPSLVVSSRLPSDNFIQVDSTIRALGFDYPLFFNVTSHIKMDNDRFILFGVFFIPVKDEIDGSEWLSVLPNAINSIDSISTNKTKIIIDWK